VVSLIGATRTTAGFRVDVRLDRRSYELRQQISKTQMAKVQLRPHETHPKWNYTIVPNDSKLN
jgi:hypothetical protein